MHVKRLLVWPTLLLGLALPCLDCSAADALSCDELNQGTDAVGKLDVDVKIKAFLLATADLTGAAKQLKTDVKTACVGIATSLGVTDTWTALGDTDDAISNGSTGACDQASAKITAILQANADAHLTVTVVGGQCTVNADVQASCEGTCKADVTCTEPDITLRCDPGKLTGQCDATCSANAYCEGSVMVAATCQGSCSANCTGTCSGSCAATITGTCMGTCEGKCDGTATPAGGMANCAGMCEGKCTTTGSVMCTGKCDATCTGKCDAECKLDVNAMVNCGAMVSCRGGCSAMYTAPKCEGELKPPVCMGDATCQGSCTSRAELQAHCDPAKVTVAFSGSTDDLTKLKTALEANLPKLWVAARKQGELLVDGGKKIVATAGGAASAAASSTKAAACVAAAGVANVKASASVSVSFSASASVTNSCNAN